MRPTGREVVRLSHDPDATIAQLAEVIARDPVLAGKILKASPPEPDMKEEA